MQLYQTSSLPQSLSIPSLQSKKLNQATELNWKDWCHFMLLLLSKESSFFLLSHFSGEVKLHYCARKVCRAKLFWELMSPSVPLSCRSLQGHQECQETPQCLSMIQTSRMPSSLRSYCAQWALSHGGHLRVKWHKQFMGSSFADELHILISATVIMSHGVCSGCKRHIIC